MTHPLIQVLLDILAHLTPPFPHAHNVSYTNFHVNYNVDDLIACTLVCRDWSWPARVTLFQEVMLIRPPPGYTGTRRASGVCSPEVLASGSRARVGLLLTALGRRPALGLVIRALCITCNDAVLEDIQRVLAVSPNIHSVLFSFDSESLNVPVMPSDLLAQLSPTPSVRLLGAVWECGWQDGYAGAHRAFPSLHVLHVRGKSFVRDGVPILPSIGPQGIHLRELRLGACIAAEDRLFCERLAELCPIRVLRIGFLQNVEDCVLPFARTLEELDIMEIRHPRLMYNDQLADIARECTRIRRFNTRNYVYMPTALPPNLEHFECEPRLLLFFHDAESIFNLLGSLSQLRKITLYGNHDIHTGITQEGEQIIRELAPQLGLEIEVLTLNQHASLNRFWGYQ
ncbi:hypothetical protein AURDEDRAFT_115186 [Auricularia subglabra TFB-10046 SS5]|nr:hypothetical protein AURDEDRAFT_115186 [Auricularia subglabra TFB-10046 SS5]